MTWEQWCRVLEGEQLPAAVVDLDAFDRNVSELANLAGARGHRLRLATKSVRVPALIRRALDHGAPYQGLMCYSAAEAALLHGRGFDDLLIAYPTLHPTDLAAIRELTATGATVRLVVDSVDGLRALGAAMGSGGADRPAEAIIEVDMSLRPLQGRLHLGVRRSPVRSIDDVVALYEAAREIDGVRVVGLMGYEAQVAGLGDRNPFRRWTNPVARVLRSRSVQAVARTRGAIAEALLARGFDLEVFNGAGTGSLTYAVDEPWLTEVTAGSALLCSHLFDYYSNVRFEPAAFFALQAVRASDPGYVTCQFGGYVASGEPGWDKVPVPWLPRGAELMSAEACGEVQTPLKLPPGVDVRPGQPVLFRHAKAGELAERFNEYLLVSGGKIVERAETYRGLGCCFG